MIFVDQKARDDRLEICKACEEYNKTRRQCKKCKCIMPAKVMFHQARCPIGKW